MGSDYNRLDHESPSLALSGWLYVYKVEKDGRSSHRERLPAFLENKNELYPERDRIEGSC